jgi:hypothetical protein
MIISMVISMNSMQTVIGMVRIIVEVSAMRMHVVLLVRCTGILSLVVLHSVMELSLQVVEEVIVRVLNVMDHLGAKVVVTVMVVSISSIVRVVTIRVVVVMGQLMVVVVLIIILMSIVAVTIVVMSIVAVSIIVVACLVLIVAI